MKFMQTIRQHAAMASGNFATMFKEIVIPPLPAAVANLLKEINRPEPKVARLSRLISADPEIAANVLRTVNSSLYGLQNPVQTIEHAVTMLGLERIQSLVLSYSMLKTIPRPEIDIFDHQAYWTDSLLQALLSRRLCHGSHRGQEELAFTASLLADVALPLLLGSWQKYYQPILKRWKSSPTRLSEIERGDFGWDHGQAGAWILQQWDFPPELVCLVGAHNLPPEKLRELELADTSAQPVSVAACLPSILKPSPESCQELLVMAHAELGLDSDAWPDLIASLEEDFISVCRQFQLSPQGASTVLTLLSETVAEEKDLTGARES